MCLPMLSDLFKIKAYTSCSFHFIILSTVFNVKILYALRISRISEQRSSDFSQSEDFEKYSSISFMFFMPSSRARTASIAICTDDFFFFKSSISREMIATALCRDSPKTLFRKVSRKYKGIC